MSDFFNSMSGFFQNILSFFDNLFHNFLSFFTVFNLVISPLRTFITTATFFPIFLAPFITLGIAVLAIKVVLDLL